jgi:hypothetical protein
MLQPDTEQWMDAHHRIAKIVILVPEVVDEDYKRESGVESAVNVEVSMYISIYLTIYLTNNLYINLPLYQSTSLSIYRLLSPIFVLQPDLTWYQVLDLWILTFIYLKHSLLSYMALLVCIYVVMYLCCY